MRTNDLYVVQPTHDRLHPAGQNHDVPERTVKRTANVCSQNNNHNKDQQPTETNETNTPATLTSSAHVGNENYEGRQNPVVSGDMDSGLLQTYVSSIATSSSIGFLKLI